MTPLRVIRGLGGNGGTFLARVLAAQPGVVLLSETNPASANLFAFELNPVQQIGAHYHQLELPRYDGNVTELGAPPFFGAFIRQLAEDCAARGRHLIIRDYNYADYIGAPFLLQPSGVSSLDVALDGMKTRDLLLIRHPVSQYASLLSHPELENVLTPEVFLTGYQQLLDQHPLGRRLRYEDLYGAFDDMLAAIAGYFELTVDDNWPDRLPQIDWMTGHALGKISVRPNATRQALDPAIRETFNTLSDYHMICRFCGYEN